MFGKDAPAADYSVLPTAIFTDPELGSVGLTEEQAREDHDVGIGQGHRLLGDIGGERDAVDRDLAAPGQPDRQRHAPVKLHLERAVLDGQDLVLLRAVYLQVDAAHRPAVQGLDAAGDRDRLELERVLVLDRVSGPGLLRGERLLRWHDRPVVEGGGRDDRGRVDTGQQVVEPDLLLARPELLGR